jgi:hypothetical protein
MYPLDVGHLLRVEDAAATLVVTSASVASEGVGRTGKSAVTVRDHSPSQLTLVRLRGRHPIAAQHRSTTSETSAAMASTLLLHQP